MIGVSFRCPELAAAEITGFLELSCSTLDKVGELTSFCAYKLLLALSINHCVSTQNLIENSPNRPKHGRISQDNRNHAKHRSIFNHFHVLLFETRIFLWTESCQTKRIPGYGHRNGNLSWLHDLTSISPSFNDVLGIIRLLCKQNPLQKLVSNDPVQTRKNTSRSFALRNCV